MHGLDVAATQWINGWSGQNGIIDVLMIWSSALGVPLVVLATAGQWWAVRQRAHVRHAVVAAGLSFLLGLALNQLILLFVHRMRPYDAGLTHLLIAPSADFSFPSDHATAAAAVAAAFLSNGLKRRGIAFLAGALLIAVSRVYVGTHYLSDVLGGAATGILAAVMIQAVYRERTRLDRFVTSIL